MTSRFPEEDPIQRRDNRDIAESKAISIKLQVRGQALPRHGGGQISQTQACQIRQFLICIPSAVQTRAWLMRIWIIDLGLLLAAARKQKQGGAGLYFLSFS